MINEPQTGPGMGPHRAYLSIDEVIRVAREVDLRVWCVGVTVYWCFHKRSDT